MINLKEFSGGVKGIPQYQDRKAMWSALRISSVGDTTPSIAKYLNALSSLYINGNVQYGCFYLGESEVLDWYASRNQLREMQFFFDIWLHEGLTSVLPLASLYEKSNSHFEDSSAFQLGGSLASALQWGGAYQDPDWSGAISKELGENAAIDLLSNDYDNCVLYEASSAWCEFFFDVAWDRTWVILNKKSRMLSVIMATDTD